MTMSLFPPGGIDLAEEAVAEEMGWSLEDLLEGAHPVSLDERVGEDVEIDDEEDLAFGALDDEDEDEDLLPGDDADVAVDEGGPGEFAGIFGGMGNDEDEDVDVQGDPSLPVDASPVDPGLSADPGIVLPGRVAMAQRARDARAGRDPETVDPYGIGYARGYLDALRQANLVDADEEAEVFGTFWLALGGAAATQVVSPLVRGVTGRKTIPVAEFFENLGRGAGEALGTRRPPPSPRRPGRAAAVAVAPAVLAPVVAPGTTMAHGPIEADRADLPPVYVADTPGVKNAVAAAFARAFPPVAHGSFPVTDRFGAAAEAGFVGRQARQGATDAARRALVASTSSLGRVHPGVAAAFAEDPGATPVLFADGTAWDPVHGRLVLVPCPSCSAVHPGAVRQGQAQSCAVCGGDHGAILVPAGDVPAYAGLRSATLVQPDPGCADRAIVPAAWTNAEGSSR